MEKFDDLGFGKPLYSNGILDTKSARYTAIHENWSILDTDSKGVFHKYPGIENKNVENKCSTAKKPHIHCFQKITNIL